MCHMRSSASSKPASGRQFVPLASRLVRPASILAALLLAELRRFEHFGSPKYLSLLELTPEGRHYSGVSDAGAVVILGGGWAGSSSFNFVSNRPSSGSGSL